MTQAKHGDSVRVNYVGKLDDGSIFDTTDGDEPIEFVIGEEEVLPDFESAVIGMSVGEKRTINIPAANAYGDYDDEMVFEVGIDQLAEGFEPELGLDVLVTLPDGETHEMTIVDIEEEMVILDANHPLAGENLTFDIELVAIIN